MTRTVQLNCPIKAEIRAVDSQSDLRFVIVMISSEIIVSIHVMDSPLKFPSKFFKLIRSGSLLQ